MQNIKRELFKKKKQKQKQNKTACQSWHQKFLVSCKFCRETFYKACHNFNIVKETLLKGLDPIGKGYIENFIKDFLCMLRETLQTNFQVSEVVCVPLDVLKAKFSVF